MSITIADITFDDYEYDDRGDVLYLSVGPPGEPARTLETTEGHAVHYDKSGAIVGLTLMAVRWTLEREGELTLSLPPARVSAAAVDAILAAA